MAIIVGFIVDPSVEDPIVSGTTSISVAGNESGPFSVNEAQRLVVKGKQQANRNDAGEWVFPLLMGKITDYGGGTLAELDPLPTVPIPSSDPPAVVWTADFAASSTLSGCDCELRVSEYQPSNESQGWTFHFDLGLEPCGTMNDIEAENRKRKTIRPLDEVRSIISRIDPCSLIDVDFLKPFDDVDKVIKKGDTLHIITNFPNFKLAVPLFMEAYTVTDNDETGRRVDKLHPDKVASGFPKNRKELFRLYIPHSIKPQSRYLEIHIGFVGLAGKPCIFHKEIHFEE